MGFETTSADIGFYAGLGAIVAAMMIPILIVAVVTFIGWWKVFTKANQPGWAAIIPIYNLYIITKITGRQGWWIALFFLSIIPVIGGFVALFASIILYHDLSKSFGKDAGFTVGLILLSPVFALILGFGSAQYVGPMASGFGLAPNPNTPNPNTPGGQPMPPQQGFQAGQPMPTEQPPFPAQPGASEQPPFPPQQ